MLAVSFSFVVRRQFVHHNANLQWWMSIVVTALCARTVMFPLQLYNIRSMNKLATIQPQLNELQRLSAQTATREEKYEYQVKMQQLFTSVGVHPFSMFISPLVSLPVFLTFYRALTHLVVRQHESMSDGGTLWFTDLTVADPYYRLPLINACIMLVNLQVGMDGMPAQTRGPTLWFMRGLVMLAVTSQQQLRKARSISRY